MAEKTDIIINAKDNATGTISRVRESMSSLATTATIAAASLATIGLWKGLLSLTSYAEQAAISFETLLGSAEKARDMLADIDEFASKTPFEKTDLTPLVQQLIGMGFAGEQALPIISVLGDSISALWRGREDLKGVILAIGQIQTKGKLSAEELLQLAERGLPVYDILRQKLNLTQKELSNLGNAGISSAVGISALLTGLNERFAGAMLKQSTTLQGSWSNLMDNLKTLATSAGKSVNDSAKNAINSINNFIGANYNTIKKTLEDTFVFFTNAISFIGSGFSEIFSLLGEGLSFLMWETQKSTSGQFKAWSLLFMGISNGLIITVWAIKIMINSVVWGFKILWNAFKTISDGIISGIIFTVAAALSPLQDLINAAISGYNVVAEAFGKTGVKSVNFANTLADKATSFMVDSWSNGAEKINSAWEETTWKIGDDFSGVIGKLTSNYKQYSRKVEEGSTQQSDLWDRIKTQLGTIKDGIKDTGTASGGATAKAKEHAEELKKLGERVNDSLKPVIDRFKDNKTAIEQSTQKLKEQMKAFGEWKNEGVKALSDVRREIVNLKKEAQDITVKFSVEKNEKLGERFVQLNKEIADARDQVAKLNSEMLAGNDTDGEKTKQVADLQAQIANLEKEKAFIQNNTTQSVLDQQVAYSQLSESARIVADLEKQRQASIDENTAKQNAALEKQAILEAQVNAQKVGDQSIRLSMINGIQEAEIKANDGKWVAIKNADNIALAYQIEERRAQMALELQETTNSLAQKLSQNTRYIAELRVAYREFNQYLSDDTASTAQKMFLSLRGVSAELRNVIELQRAAGLTATPAPSTATPPPLPWATNTASRNAVSNNVSVNISGVSVRSNADINTLANAVGDVLTRKLELYKLGIS